MNIFYNFATDFYVKVGIRFLHTYSCQTEEWCQKLNYKAAANPYRIIRRGEAVLYKGDTTPSFGTAEPCHYIYLWHLDK